MGAKTFKQLSIEEREVIQRGLWEKKSIRAIAKAIGRPPSSVSREIKRNLPPERARYAPRLAHDRALEKRTSRGRKDRLKSDSIRTYVVEQLKAGYSPEQISGRMKREKKGTISHEAIYQYIYAQFKRSGYGRCVGEDLRSYLKRRHNQRHTHGARKYQRVLRPHFTSIEERPKVVEKRRRIGDWEGDSMISKKSKVALNTLVERKTGLVFITKIRDGTAKATEEAVTKRLSILPPEVRKTLTLDNGHENTCHDELHESLGVDCYAAHPYSSWERGTNENTNGLIRWYLPKGTDFATVSDEDIKAIETALNNRPRKRLKWLTPLEAFTSRVALTH